jgi:coenzyme Q-binding protein COQ10
VTTWRFQPAASQSTRTHTSFPPAVDHKGSSQSRSTSGGYGDDGPTLVTLDLEFAFANPMHAMVSAAFFGQVSKLMVKAFEERCLEVYGTGQQ